MNSFWKFTLYEEVISLFKSVKNGDTLDWLKAKTSFFDVFYFRVFISLFLLANIVFLFYTCHFLFGFCDFGFIKHGLRIELWNGRYTNAIPLKLLGGNITPILNTLVSVVAMVTSSMLLCAFFKLPQRMRYWLTVGLLPILLPYVMPWFYFAFETFSHSMLPGLAIIALWLVKNRLTLERMFISIFIVWFVLGVYPSILSFFALCIGLHFILDLIDRMDNRLFVQRYARFAGILIAGCILFKATIYALRMMGKMAPSIYNLNMPSLYELVQKFFPELYLSFKQFFHPTPYIPVSIKLLLFAIIAVAVYLTMHQAMRPQTILDDGKQRIMNWYCHFCRVFLVGIVWLFMFFATMLPDYLSRIEFAFVVRTAYFSIPFFVVISATIVFRLAAKPVANVILFIIIFILWCSAISDLEIQKNWKIGFDNEVLAYSRVLSMIEQSPEVCSLTLPINYLQIGSLPSGRRPFCRPLITDGEDSLELHSLVFNPDWSPRSGVIFDYLGTHLKWKYNGSFRSDISDIGRFFDLTSPRWLDFLRNACPYPAPPERCLFVDTDSNSLVIVFDKQTLEKLKIDYGITEQKE